MTSSADLLDDDPDDPTALFMTGWAFLQHRKYGVAYALLRRSADMQERHETFTQIAIACMGMHRLEEARKWLQKALDMDASSTAALNSMAKLALFECDPAEAIRYGNLSLAQNSAQQEPRGLVGSAHLMRGEFAPGWDGYEATVGVSKDRPLRQPYSMPYWSGQNGVRLFLQGEQGLGDEISFASILPDALQHGCSITLECEPNLTGLFQRSFPQVEIHGSSHGGRREWCAGRRWDCYALIGTLARYYRPSLESFPGQPYLVADPDRRVPWRALLDTLPGRKVGLAWTGGFKETFRDRRSLSLERLLPLLKTPGMTWISLQYEDPTAEIATFQRRHGILVHHWKQAAESDDYDDQAALVSELDVLVTVATSIAHLAGALGKLAYVLVPEKPRWFYGLQGERSPWYGSWRLMRQAGAWPLEAIAAKLQEKPCASS